MFVILSLGCSGILGFNLDITQQKRTEQKLHQQNTELQQVNNELERVGRSKDQLLAMISHELRTPLVTGLGYLEMVLYPRLPAFACVFTERLELDSPRKEIVLELKKP